MSLEEAIGYVGSDELIKVVYDLFIQIVFPKVNIAPLCSLKMLQLIHDIAFG